MKRYYYDLHIHSCLSPCADNSSTPTDIAGVAKLNSLDIAALTDHNTAKNCPAFFEAAKSYGILPIAGMELTTAEDIHVVCLFKNLKSALDFDVFLEDKRANIKNREEIFGEQLIMDKDENVIGKEDKLLIAATSISVEDVRSAVEAYGGICYPAHIDKEANSIITVLGTLPHTLGFRAAEIHSRDKIEAYKRQFELDELVFTVSSDAHTLLDISEGQNYFLLDDGLSGDALLEEVFKHLR